MNVIVRKKKNTDGTTSLRLDIYHSGKRWYEPLQNVKLSPSSNLNDREYSTILLLTDLPSAPILAIQMGTGNFDNKINY